MSSHLFRYLLLSFGLFTPMSAFADSWTIDKSHSSVGFEVDHMMISTVQGYFGNFSGNLDTNSKGTLVSMSGIVHINSVDTNDQKRDGHLQSPDFFSASTFPTMTFQSTKISGSHKKGYKVKGEMSIRGVTKPVTLNFRPFKGPMIDGWGNTKVGTVAQTAINRQDFGLSWNNTLDSGGLVVGDEVRITLNLQLIQVQ
jgi:polyisoprenoid-binding protein YceI